MSNDLYKDAFTNDTQTEPLKNVLELTLDEGFALPDHTHAALQMHAASSVGVTDVAGLKRRIMEYIEVLSFNAHMVRTLTVNRRFNRLAGKFGTTVPNIITDLVNRNLITEFNRDGARGWMSKRVLDSMKEQAMLIDQSTGTGTSDRYMQGLYRRLANNVE